MASRRAACDFEARHDSDKSDAGRTNSPYAAAAEMQHIDGSPPGQHKAYCEILPRYQVLHGCFSGHTRPPISLYMRCGEAYTSSRRLYHPVGLSSRTKEAGFSPESTTVVVLLRPHITTFLFYRDDTLC